MKGLTACVKQFAAVSIIFLLILLLIWTKRDKEERGASKEEVKRLEKAREVEVGVSLSLLSLSLLSWLLFMSLSLP